MPDSGRGAEATRREKERGGLVRYEARGLGRQRGCWWVSALVLVLPAFGFLSSPTQRLRGNPRKMSRQGLLSLCSSTRAVAQRKGRSLELTWGLALLARDKAGLCVKAGFLKVAGFLKKAAFFTGFVVW